MTKPLSIQLYTVRESCSKDFPGTLRQIAQIGYKGVEFAGLHGMSPADVAALVKELGLKVSSSHVSMPTRENIAQLEDQEKTLGNTLLIAGLGPSDFETMDLCKKSAARFQEACQLAHERGLRMGCHNHWWEFHRVEGRLVYDILLEAARDLLAELDVYWAAFGKSDPVEVVRKYRSRIPVLHIKDGPLEEGKPHQAVGSGKLDMKAIIGAADPAVLEWLIVELDACETDMMDAVRESYRYLVSSGLATGNV